MPKPNRARMLVPVGNRHTLNAPTFTPYDRIVGPPAFPAPPDIIDPTRQVCRELTVAFDYFNKTLFGGRLNPCMITLQRRRQTAGYFAKQRFQTRDGTVVVDEIALNPDTFHSRPVDDILSTLVHEQVHALQFRYGRPSPGRYHNKEFAAWMERIGLISSHTGAPGGKRTGPQMSHYVDPAGAFARECAALMADGIDISFIDRWAALRSAGLPPEKINGDDENRREAKLASKTKFVCPSCGTQAWGKQSLKVDCRPCRQPMRAAQEHFQSL